MKNLVLFIFSILLLSNTSCAGEDVKNWNGKIVYSIEFSSPDAYGPQGPSEMVTYIGKGFTRVEQGSSIGLQITLNSIKSGVTTILLDLGGQKVAISTEVVKDGSEPVPTIDLLDETKVIAGYECRKARYTILKQGKQVTFEVFYTPDLPSEANTQFTGLNGYPMQYAIESDGITMTYTAKSVSEEKVDKSLGEIPEGYEQMSYSEFMKMISGE